MSNICQNYQNVHDFKLNAYKHKNILAKFYGMRFFYWVTSSYQQFSLPHTVFLITIVLKLFNRKFHRVCIYYLQVAYMIFLHSYICVPAITKIITNIFIVIKEWLQKNDRFATLIVNNNKYWGNNISTVLWHKKNKFILLISVISKKLSIWWMSKSEEFTQCS